MLRRSLLVRGPLVETTFIPLLGAKRQPSANLAVLTLTNPATRNAMSVAMGDEFAAAVRQIQANRDTRGVLLTGAGQAFSAGGDVAFLTARLTDTPNGNVEAMKRYYRRFLCLRDLTVPVVAAINGHAMGAGFCVALACDARVAAKPALMAVNFVRLGIHPGMAATFSLPRLVGSAAASELLLTGQTISAERAYQLGLVTKVTETPEECRQEATKLLVAMAGESSRIAVSETLKTLRGSDAELERALDREALAQAECYLEGRDLTEALDALKQKRTPVFS